MKTSNFNQTNFQPKKNKTKKDICFLKVDKTQFEKVNNKFHTFFKYYFEQDKFYYIVYTNSLTGILHLQIDFLSKLYALKSDGYMPNSEIGKIS